MLLWKPFKFCCKNLIYRCGDPLKRRCANLRMALWKPFKCRYGSLLTLRCDNIKRYIIIYIPLREPSKTVVESFRKLLWKPFKKTVVENV